jgi:hypothetical protein
MNQPRDLLHVVYVDTKSTYRLVRARSSLSTQEIYTADESGVAKSGLGM